MPESKSLTDCFKNISHAMKLLLVECSNSDVLWLLACLFCDVQFNSIPVLLFVLPLKDSIMPLLYILQENKIIIRC
jgi:hypothetical protein